VGAGNTVAYAYDAQGRRKSNAVTQDCPNDLLNQINVTVIPVWLPFGS
jgi:hypothetical protein